MKFFNLIDDVPGAVDSGYAVSFISGDERKGGELLGQWLATKLRCRQGRDHHRHAGQISPPTIAPRASRR